MSETFVKTSSGRGLVTPSGEGISRIHAAAAAEPSQGEPGMRPADGGVSPGQFAESAEFHLDDDLVRIFRSTGDGWQGRVNAALRQFLREHSLTILP
ncbi:MAG: BrnA antitoxin family protein [Betaproteobacteria bacterium]|nr:BrnA antitoxin family protein [Betaproteobacteria bacterium]